ncbi:hypothetical protein KP509_1Z031800 [Ceratopteris richardii]|nr:hypothetical protein KP509_1Z149800 [Ceratopteris richardii]KAH6557130.1 hypothetical protein KP509_1Z133000 [Ceratopteris richardii]KAH6557454.1 hypothetical protein KP509_1Z113900 [Ceratopteris richardii]KAH6559013.1 hypothetical protein KP509_1Z031800 [Ceratopteris richardii]
MAPQDVHQHVDCPPSAARATTSLCIENCGFYGPLRTAAAALPALRRFVSLREHPPPGLSPNTTAPSDAKSYEISSRSQLSTSSASDEKCFPSAPSGTLDKTKPNRCFSCRRRVGLAGFKCRCGNLFCSVHRYSEEHNCTFDYTARAKKEIAANNPIVKPPKIHKI